MKKCLSKNYLKKARKTQENLTSGKDNVFNFVLLCQQLNSIWFYLHVILLKVVCIRHVSNAMKKLGKKSKGIPKLDLELFEMIVNIRANFHYLFLSHPQRINLLRTYIFINSLSNLQTETQLSAFFESNKYDEFL